jgi:hypothetical protein
MTPRCQWCTGGVVRLEGGRSHVCPDCNGTGFAGDDEPDLECDDEQEDEDDGRAST